MAEQAVSIEQRLAAVLNPPAETPEKAPAAPQAAPEPQAEAEYQPSSAGAVEGEEATPVEGAEAPAAEAPGWFPERLEDIAEAGGWDVADLYKVRVKVNGPDGKPVEVSIGEWKDAYQQSAQLDAIRRAEREAHERAEHMRQQTLSQVQQQAAEIQTLTQAAEQRLFAKWQGVNWDQLRALDPAEWAAKRAEFTEEAQHLNTIKQQAFSNLQQQWQQQQAEQAGKYQQFLREQADEAKALIPEFSDTEKVPEVQRETLDWMKGRQYSDFEIGMVSHSAKLLRLVRNEMKLSKAGTEAKKVVNTPKKFLKPGAAQQKGSKEADAYQAARSRLRKSGKTDDAAAVFKRMFGG
jgi:hypothetical protein